MQQRQAFLVFNAAFPNAAFPISPNIKPNNSRVTQQFSITSIRMISEKQWHEMINISRTLFHLPIKTHYTILIKKDVFRDPDFPFTGDKYGGSLLPPQKPFANLWNPVKVPNVRSLTVSALAKCAYQHINNQPDEIAIH
jgi:hypothetical protein